MGVGRAGRWLLESGLPLYGPEDLGSGDLGPASPVQIQTFLEQVFLPGRGDYQIQLEKGSGDSYKRLKELSGKDSYRK